MNATGNELMLLWPRAFGVRPYAAAPTPAWAGVWSPDLLAPGRYRACIESAERVEAQAYDVVEGCPLAATYGGPGTIEVDFVLTKPTTVQVRCRLRPPLEPLTPGVRAVLHEAGL